jgi:excisionase family DNA binding protein
MTHHPPKKKNGDARGPRRFNGALMDVASAAAYFGATEGWVRSQVSRGRLRARKLGGRIIFARSDIEEFIAGLPVVYSIKEVRGE